jgi:triosephosphate isomerase
MKKKIIVGNWKMNPTNLLDAKKIVSSVNKLSTKLNNTDVVLCPPFIYLPKLVSNKKRISAFVTTY